MGVVTLPGPEVWALMGVVTLPGPEVWALMGAVAQPLFGGRVAGPGGLRCCLDDEATAALGRQKPPPGLP